MSKNLPFWDMHFLTCPTTNQSCILITEDDLIADERDFGIFLVRIKPESFSAFQDLMDFYSDDTPRDISDKLIALKSLLLEDYPKLEKRFIMKMTRKLVGHAFKNEMPIKEEFLYPYERIHPPSARLITENDKLMVELKVPEDYQINPAQEWREEHLFCSKILYFTGDRFRATNLISWFDGKPQGQVDVSGLMSVLINLELSVSDCLAESVFKHYAEWVFYDEEELELGDTIFGHRYYDYEEYYDDEEEEKDEAWEKLDWKCKLCIVREVKIIPQEVLEIFRKKAF